MRTQEQPSARPAQRYHLVQGMPSTPSRISSDLPHAGTADATNSGQDGSIVTLHPRPVTSLAEMMRLRSIELHKLRLQLRAEQQKRLVQLDVAIPTAHGLYPASSNNPGEFPWEQQPTSGGDVNTLDMQAWQQQITEDLARETDFTARDAQLWGPNVASASTAHQVHPVSLVPRTRASRAANPINSARLVDNAPPHDLAPTSESFLFPPVGMNPTPADVYALHRRYHPTPSFSPVPMPALGPPGPQVLDRTSSSVNQQRIAGSPHGRQYKRTEGGVRTCDDTLLGSRPPSHDLPLGSAPVRGPQRLQQDPRHYCLPMGAGAASAPTVLHANTRTASGYGIWRDPLSQPFVSTPGHGAQAEYMPAAPLPVSGPPLSPMSTVLPTCSSPSSYVPMHSQALHAHHSNTPSSRQPLPSGRFSTAVHIPTSSPCSSCPFLAAGTGVQPICSFATTSPRPPPLTNTSSTIPSMNNPGLSPRFPQFHPPDHPTCKPVITSSPGPIPTPSNRVLPTYSPSLSAPFLAPNLHTPLMTGGTSPSSADWLKYGVCSPVQIYASTGGQAAADSGAGASIGAGGETRMEEHLGGHYGQLLAPQVDTVFIDNTELGPNCEQQYEQLLGLHHSTVLSDDIIGRQSPLPRFLGGDGAVAQISSAVSQSNGLMAASGCLISSSVTDADGMAAGADMRAGSATKPQRDDPSGAGILPELQRADDYIRTRMTASLRLGENNVKISEDGAVTQDDHGRENMTCRATVMRREQGNDDLGSVPMTVNAFVGGSGDSITPAIDKPLTDVENIHVCEPHQDPEMTAGAAHADARGNDCTDSDARCLVRDTMFEKCVMNQLDDHTSSAIPPVPPSSVLEECILSHMNSGGSDDAIFNVLRDDGAALDSCFDVLIPAQMDLLGGSHTREAGGDPAGDKNSTNKLVHKCARQAPGHTSELPAGRGTREVQHQAVPCDHVHVDDHLTAASEPIAHSGAHGQVSGNLLQHRVEAATSALGSLLEGPRMRESPQMKEDAKRAMEEECGLLAAVKQIDGLRRCDTVSPLPMNRQHSRSLSPVEGICLEFGLDTPLEAHPPPGSCSLSPALAALSHLELGPDMEVDDLTADNEPWSTLQTAGGLIAEAEKAEAVRRVQSKVRMNSCTSTAPAAFRVLQISPPMNAQATTQKLPAVSQISRDEAHSYIWDPWYFQRVVEAAQHHVTLSPSFHPPLVPPSTSTARFSQSNPPNIISPMSPMSPSSPLAVHGDSSLSQRAIPTSTLRIRAAAQQYRNLLTEILGERAKTSSVDQGRSEADRLKHWQGMNPCGGVNQGEHVRSSTTHANANPQQFVQGICRMDGKSVLGDNIDRTAEGTAAKGSTMLSMNSLGVDADYTASIAPGDTAGRAAGMATPGGAADSTTGTARKDTAGWTTGSTVHEGTHGQKVLDTSAVGKEGHAVEDVPFTDVLGAGTFGMEKHASEHAPGMPEGEDTAGCMVGINGHRAAGVQDGDRCAASNALEDQEGAGAIEACCVMGARAGGSTTGTADVLRAGGITPGVTVDVACEAAELYGNEGDRTAVRCVVGVRPPAGSCPEAASARRAGGQDGVCGAPTSIGGSIGGGPPDNVELVAVTGVHKCVDVCEGVDDGVDARGRTTGKGPSDGGLVSDDTAVRKPLSMFAGLDGANFLQGQAGAARAGSTTGLDGHEGVDGAGFVHGVQATVDRCTTGAGGNEGVVGAEDLDGNTHCTAIDGNTHCTAMDGGNTTDEVIHEVTESLRENPWVLVMLRYKCSLKRAVEKKDNGQLLWMLRVLYRMAPSYLLLYVTQIVPLLKSLYDCDDAVVRRAARMVVRRWKKKMATKGGVGMQLID